MMEIRRTVSNRFRSVVSPITNLKKQSTTFRRLINCLPDWVTPDRVTYTRFVMVIPMLYMILNHLYWQTLFCFGFAMLLDAIDGALAEIRGLQSEWGAFIDPLADKAIICTALVALLSHLPSAFIWTTAVTCLFAFGLTVTRIAKMIRDNGHDIPANKASIMAKLPGKAKCWSEITGIVIVLISLAISVSGLTWIAFGFLCLAAILGFFSLWSQFRGLLSGSK